jgi:hypothetical protein
MNPLLHKVKDVYQEGCVSLIIPTHRTHPENKNDSINLKNAIKEAAERLTEEFDKKYAETVVEKLNKLSETIDHNQNLESLIVFANQDCIEYTRLPISIEHRVVVDNTFATRDLVRALHQEAGYYVLVLSRDQARLIEAQNDAVVAENNTLFPVENMLYSTDKLKLAQSKVQDSMIQEFFNRVDKLVIEATRRHPLPVVIATEKRNYDHYMSVADRPSIILTHLPSNRDNDAAKNIVKDAWPLVKEIVNQRHQDRIVELKEAVNKHLFVSDYNEILRAIQEGRGKTLFVKKGFFQPALIENDEIVLVPLEDAKKAGVIDDVIDEIIEHNLFFGGDTVFIEDDSLRDFDNLALVTRY